MLTNPGRDPSYDNCTTTLDSQPISPCPSGDDKMFTGFQEMTNAARLTTPMLDGSNLYSVPEVTRPAAVDDNQSILEVRVPVQDLSLCVSEDVKPSTELVELEISELLMSENLCDLTKKSDPAVTGVRTGNSDDSILKVDVSMSPQSLQRATQTCLTPGEWQSVNDMPRMNRTPYTNQTQRITPLKEKVRRSKQRNHVQYADNAVEGFNYNGVADSVSSNCSTVSTTLSFNNSNPEAKSSKGTKYETMMISSAGCPLDNCRDVIAGSNRERVQDCQHYFKTGTMIDGDDGNLEEEENAACNFSDISSRDELFIDSTAYLDLQHSTEGRTLDSKIFDGSVRNLNDICGKLNLSQIYNESDTDSDNDLGHFYAPSPLSKRCNSEDRLGPSSLGYISSYPSVVSKSIN